MYSCEYVPEMTSQRCTACEPRTATASMQEKDVGDMATESIPVLNPKSPKFVTTF